MTKKQQLIVDIIQWILIGILVIACSIVFMGKCNIQEREKTLLKQNTYIRIHNSKQIATLTKKNTELSDSIIVLTKKLEECSKQK